MSMVAADDVQFLLEEEEIRHVLDGLLDGL